MIMETISELRTKAFSDLERDVVWLTDRDMTRSMWIALKVLNTYVSELEKELNEMREKLNKIDKKVDNSRNYGNCTVAPFIDSKSVKLI